MSIKIKSAKQKGRKMQKDIAETIKGVFSLENSDVVSNPSCCTGMDIILSNRAKALFPFAVEAKHQENLNIWSALKQAEDNAEGLMPLLVFRRNHTDSYACMKFSEFIKMVQAVNDYNKLQDRMNGLGL